MIPRCTGCEILVEQNASFCFNCGIENPTAETFVRKESKHTFSFTFVGALFFATIIASIVAVVTYQEKPESLWRNIGCSFATSILLGFVFSSMATSFIESRLSKAAWKRSREALAADTLCRREEELVARISVLAEEEASIRGLMDPDHEPTKPDAEEMRLFTLVDIISLETTVFHMLIAEIDLLRLKNNHYHVQSNLNSLSRDALEECLELIGSPIGDENPVVESKILDDAAPGESGEGDLLQEKEFIDDTQDAGEIIGYTFDTSDFASRIDDRQADLFARTAQTRESYRFVQKALRRRCEAIDQRIAPIAEEMPDLDDAKRFASAETVKIFDVISGGYNDLFDDLRREFDELNSGSALAE